MAIHSILILSAGSFLGKNYLDVLEGRREAIDLIGLNSISQNQHIFRYDFAYKSPPLTDIGGLERLLLELVEKHQPKLILPGRDDDVIFLSNFKEKYALHTHRIPTGKAAIADLLRDKYTCFRWAEKKGLPFVPTCDPKDSKNSLSLGGFIEKIGFPLIVKSKRGFASRDVFVAMDDAHVENLMQLDGIVFQKYLQPPKELSQLLTDYDRAMPLCFQVPERSQYALQSLIKSDGSHTPNFAMKAHLKMGRLEQAELIQEASLDQLMSDYVSALYEDGWIGPVNIQCKPDENGDWQVFEMSLRMTGGTSTRLCFGYDEFGNFMNTFYPELDFPNLGRRLDDAVIFRSLDDHVVPCAWIDTLERTGVWQKASI